MARVANAEYTGRKHNENFTLVRRPLSCLNDNQLTSGIQLQAFEWYTEGGGKHWSKLKSLAPELGLTGITALWIPREFSPPTLTLRTLTPL